MNITHSFMHIHKIFYTSYPIEFCFYYILPMCITKYSNGAPYLLHCQILNFASKSGILKPQNSEYSRGAVSSALSS